MKWVGLPDLMADLIDFEYLAGVDATVKIKTPGVVSINLRQTTGGDQQDTIKFDSLGQDHTVA